MPQTGTKGNRSRFYRILLLVIIFSDSYRRPNDVLLQRTNDPADLDLRPSGGLSSVFNTPGLVIPSEGTLPNPLVGSQAWTSELWLIKFW